MFSTSLGFAPPKSSLLAGLSGLRRRSWIWATGNLPFAEESGLLVGFESEEIPSGKSIRRLAGVQSEDVPGDSGRLLVLIRFLIGLQMCKSGSRNSSRGKSFRGPGREVAISCWQSKKRFHNNPYRRRRLRLWLLERLDNDYSSDLKR